MASFNSAFASARKAGKKVFTWSGKSYNTKLADEAPKKKGFASTPKKGPAPGARAPIPTPKPAQAAKKPGKFDGVDSDMLSTKKTAKPLAHPVSEAESFRSKFKRTVGAPTRAAMKLDLKLGGPKKADTNTRKATAAKNSKVSIVPKKEAAFITPANKKMRSDHESFIGTEKKRRNDDLRSMRGK